MKCMLCESSKNKERSGSVRDNKDLKIHECLDCGLVFLSGDEHIHESFYESSEMHKLFDFKKWRNESLTDDERRFNFLKSMLINKDILDFGSGNGGFLTKAKEVSKSVTGCEVEKAVMPYYELEELKIVNDLDDINFKYDLITSFHVIEHLKNPTHTINKLKNLLNENGKLIIEVPNANDALLTVYKKTGFSNFTYWSCHLYLYTHHTLAKLAQKCGLKVDFIKYIQRYPLANHLYWLSFNKPGGHTVWGEFLSSKELDTAYENQLASLGITDTIIACFRRD